MHCTAVLGTETAGEAEQDPTSVSPPTPERPTPHIGGQDWNNDPGAEIAHPLQGKTPGRNLNLMLWH